MTNYDIKQFAACNIQYQELNVVLGKQ